MPSSHHSRGFAVVPAFHPSIIPTCVLVLFLCLFTSCHAQPAVRTGADILVSERLDLLRNRRVALLTNQTGVLSNGVWLPDTLVSLGVQVTMLLSPEHGIRGTAGAGEHVADTIDIRTGIPIVSLYGGAKPSARMLRDVDVLVYDLQDAGARFFTYISTMKQAMEAAAEAGRAFVVLDRPDPLGGLTISGPVMEDSLRSFVGLLPLPVVYGLTCGELAAMISGEGWLEQGRHVDLEVVKMEGWRRGMSWDETGLRWIPPSPNLVSPATARVYPMTCFIEATALSEGRGTGDPFRLIGAPFVDGDRMARDITTRLQDRILVSPETFTPSSSKFAGRECRGIRIEAVTDSLLDLVEAGLTILQAFHDRYPDSVRVNPKMLGRLLGSREAVDGLLSGVQPARLREQWDAGVDAFRSSAAKYTIYTKY